MTALAVYLHRFDPFAIRLSESFGLRWYGLSYVAGFVVALLILRALAKRRLILIEPDRVGDFVVYAALGTIIGGRLGYCLFYKPELFIDFQTGFPWWGVLAVNRGGMASHGGIIGILAAVWLYARRRGVPMLHLMDLCALTGTIGVCFGRVANFINGELVGRPVSTDLPWAVKFPHDILDWPAHHPEKLPSLTPAAQLMGVDPDQWTTAITHLEVDAVAVDFVHRVTDQIVATVQTATRTGDAVAAALLDNPALLPRHPSQLYEALLEGALLFAVLWLVWRVPRKPGIVSGWFLIAYAIVRIIGEQFRLPDVHIGYERLAGLQFTRGQWLSAIMFFLGVVCLVWWSRRPAERIGGWGGGRPETPNPKPE